MSEQAKIISILEQYNIPAPLKYYIAAQSAHETNNFTSSVYLDCKNGYGYGAAGLPCPGHERYRIYQDSSQSTIEIINWIKRRQQEGRFPDNLATIISPDQYATLLKNSGYYEDSIINYANGIKRFLNLNIAPIISISSILFSVILSYILLKVINK